ncbi:hypothetical protein G5714_023780 [Onychostoma macrolepis]|uniref:PARP catalytic domain-containing protein n=1 Tax=Onychostoma macrolepis TaxID=369639 RepID=A0A7J6BM27_9TELE|nr:hypothetical protein G5714_023780 [Onychostoma macrolepis]
MSSQIVSSPSFQQLASSSVFVPGFGWRVFLDPHAVRPVSPLVLRLMVFVRLDCPLGSLRYPASEPLEEVTSFRSDIRGANMWAEDDFSAGAPPCLQSNREPVCGQVYRMYHGTTREAAGKIKVSGFKESSGGMLGRGVYLSRDLQKASRYPLDLPENQRVVLRVKVNVGKVKKIDYQGHPLQKTWHDQGYDTAWCPPGCGMVKSGLEEDCVWDPNRITVIDEIRPKTQ